MTSWTVYTSKSLIFKNCTVLRLCACSVIAIAAWAAPPDPAGWYKARWGMTVDEVAAAFSGRTRPASGPNAERPFRGTIAVLAIDGLDIDGIPAHADLLFDVDTKKLSAVTVEPDIKTPEAFVRLEALLVQKYGRAWRRSTAALHLSQWIAGDTVVRLRRAENRVGMTISVFLDITYEQRRPLNTL